jgi:endoglucanase
MKSKAYRISLAFTLSMLVSAAMLIAGCQSAKTPAPASAAAPATPVAVPSPAPAAALPSVHIKAGLTTSLTDADGVVWSADQGFEGGDTIERDADLPIANTKTPALYRSEHYGMTAFSHPVPNGKYIVKLHFAETFDGVTAAGERVFSLNVEGKEFKDFDVFVKAGGSQRAYIETVPVEITDGKLDITFTSNIENPEINGIEILPAP